MCVVVAENHVVGFICTGHCNMFKVTQSVEVWMCSGWLKDGLGSQIKLRCGPECSYLHERPPNVLLWGPLKNFCYFSEYTITTLTMDSQEAIGELHHLCNFICFECFRH